ncbi:MAG: heme-binding protein [Planctomycetales bacterium]|nr:heme-binding protein [Planctomycetales bacterium]
MIAKIVVLVGLVSAISFFAYKPLYAAVKGSFERDDMAEDQVQDALKLLREAQSTEVSSKQLALLGQAAENLGDDHPVCQSVLAPLLAATSATAEQIASATEQAIDALTFRPVKEAEMPADFPPFTPVGCLEIKSYPAYRMATATMPANENSAFWSLFQHISRNEIAMTTPVQMDHRGNEANQPQRMGFLYSSPEIGPAGVDAQDERVEVVDVPALTVASIGMRGKRTEQRLAEAETRLRQWLQTKPLQQQYEPSGARRVLGYNSPMIPTSRQYFEVQLPLKIVATDNSATGAEDSPGK